MTSKKIRYAVCSLIILAFLAISGVLFFVVDMISTKNGIYSSLKDNHCDFLISDSFVSDGGLIEAQNYKVFLAGEVKGTQKNYDVRLALIKLLNQRAGMNQYLSMLSPSVCIYLDEYLDTGDESNLEKAFSLLPQNHAENNVEHYEFWHKFYAFNSGLPDYKKISVTGLGGEVSDASTKEAFIIIKNIIDDVQTDDESLLLNFKKISETDENRLTASTLLSLFTDLKNDLKLKEAALRLALSDDFFIYASLVESVYSSVNMNFLDSINETQKNDRMEMSSYQIFQYLYAENKNDVFFGQTAIKHALQAASDSEKIGYPLARQINESTQLKHKVCSLFFTYRDSYAAGTTQQYSYRISQSMYEKEFNVFAEENQSCVLFKIDEDDSIFKKQAMIVTGASKCTADYFQYVLLINNSQAVTYR